MNYHVKNIHENPGSFKCDVCKIGFNTKLNLIAHQKSHNKNRPKPLKCKICDYATDSKATFRRHLESHEKIIEKCDKCNKILRKNHTHDCRLDCKFCGKKFLNREGVLSHIRYHHNSKPKEIFFHECDICGIKFMLKKSITNHMDKKHLDQKIKIIKTFTCDLDGKTFKNKSNITWHMKNHLPAVKCEFCHKKLKWRNLKLHIMSLHTGIKQPRKIYIPKTKNFQCHICSRIVTSQGNLTLHIRDHNKTIKCKFCNKLFGSQARLKAHITYYHENADKFGCKICGKKFNHPYVLRHHRRIHDPNRPKDLKCSQCDFATDHKHTFKGHLNSHKRKNADIAAMKNPHKCPKCPAVLRSKKIWYSHMAGVHPKFLVECDICGKNLKSKCNMLTHFRFFHKIRS